MEHDIKMIKEELQGVNLLIVSKSTGVHRNTLYKIKRGHMGISARTIASLKAYFEIE